MLEKDFADFALAWSATVAIYGKTVDDYVLQAAFSILKEFEIKDICRALQAHMGDPEVGQYMPKPADVIKRIKGDVKGMAIAGWNKAEEARRRFGKYESIVFDDKIIMQCIHEMGGWSNFCMAKNSDISFQKNEFISLYLSIMKNPPSELPSICYGQGHHAISKDKFRPMLIGDQEKALLIYEISSNAEMLKIDKAVDSQLTTISNNVIELKKVYKSLPK